MTSFDHLDASAYTYDNAGQLTTFMLPSSTGVVGTYSCDNADRMTGISWVKGGSQTLASVTYTLDNAGNRTQRVDQLGTHTYAYDNLYRLTSVTYPGPTTDTYTYDAAGNRLTKNANTYTYDAADRLTAVGATSYTFDNNGNQTGRGSDTFAWDAEDRLASATVNSTTTTFAYNGDGLRDSLTAGATTTFTWDVAAGLAQVLDDSSFKYVYGIGRIAEVGPGATTHYYLADGLGSIMALTDSSGAVLNTYDYDVFGGVRSSTGSQANVFTFMGEQTDASSNLEYLRARFHDLKQEDSSALIHSVHPLCGRSTPLSMPATAPRHTWISRAYLRKLLTPPSASRRQIEAYRTVGGCWVSSCSLGE